ncbi:MAG TPA: hypothetical protein DCG63_03780 [Methylophilaceae bacterium]|nr:hypothetical protein [Methylophilaceae bacterium]
MAQDNVKTPKKPDVKNEIASVKRDIYNINFMGLLANQDDTLLTRGNGKGLKIYDEIERDCHAFAVLQKRKMAVIAREWCVEAASENAADQRAADMVKAQLEALNFDLLTLDLLDAILKGFAVGEIMWARDGAEVVAEKILPRNQRRFVFDEDYQLRLLTQAHMMQGEIMPDRKFIVHSCGGKDGNPYGLGLGSRLFWPVFFKRQDITFWLTFADKFGSPTLLGKYPAGTLEPEQTEFINTLRAMAQDAAIGIPDNMVVELLEASRTGGADVFEKLSRYMDEQISVAVLGETMTTSAKSSGLGGNQSSVHNEVRLELVKADADLLSGTLNKTLVKWLTEFNVPGATPPRVYREVEEEEDLAQRSERDTKIYNMGFAPTLEYITETYGEGWEVKTTIKPNDKPVDTNFAEGDNPTAGDEDLLVTNTAKLWQGTIEKVSKLVNEATDLASLQKTMAAQFSDLQNEEIVNIMAAGFALAELKGLSDVQDEANIETQKNG